MRWWFARFYECCVFVGDRKGSKLPLSEGLLCVVLCVCLCCYLCLCLGAECVHGCLCEIQKGAQSFFYLQFQSGSIFHIPFSGSARLHSRSPSSTAPSPAFATINLGLNLFRGAERDQKGALVICHE